MPRKSVPGPFVILDHEGQPIRDARGAVREFSTDKRAAAFLQPGHKVSVGQR